MSRDIHDLIASWERDPAFVAAYAAAYPYEQDALALAGRRASLGLTQRAYAARIRVSWRTIEKWESGKYPVPARAWS